MSRGRRWRIAPAARRRPPIPAEPAQRRARVHVPPPSLRVREVVPTSCRWVQVVVHRPCGHPQITDRGFPPCRLSGTVAAVISVLADLAFPSRCVGCSDSRGPMCARCRLALSRPRLHRPEPVPVGLPPLTVAGAYAGPVRASLLAYKERGRRDLGGVLSAALAGAVADLVRTAPRPLVLVPVPSVAAAARARGGQHVQRLADGAARTLRRRGIPARVAPILAVTADRPDTAGLSAIERGLAAVGKYGLRRGWSAALPRSGRVVIVDDLVTTGNTMAAAAAALRDAGVRVAGGAAVAGTQRGCPGTRRATAGHHPCRSVRL